MEPINYQKEKENIQYFAQQARSFEAGELDRKDYKGISGKFGSYAQRGEGNMLRLRMPGGVMNLDKLGFVADMVERFDIDRLKLTTCQTLQLHNLFFNGVPRDQPVYRHHVFLSDPVRPVRGLVLHRHIPPGIKVNYDIRPGQVQARVQPFAVQ